MFALMPCVSKLGVFPGPCSRLVLSVFFSGEITMFDKHSMKTCYCNKRQQK